MNSIELYKLWAPEGCLWSDWVKPVLFAQTLFQVTPFPPVDWRASNVAWVPSASDGAAIILDLPEENSVWVGAALAGKGFRPIPLFNGAPGPSAIVNVGAIIGALDAVASDIGAMSIPFNAPPVFLLDSNRSGGSNFLGPGRFDNRWTVFPQDFPSANFLLANGIRSVVLGQTSSAPPQRDLAHVLLRWQEAGIQIQSCDVKGEGKPVAIRVERPGNFRMLWYRALVLAGLRRNSAGGFGAVIPEPSKGGGGFG